MAIWGLPCHPSKPVGFLAFGAKYMGFPLWSPLPIEGGSRAIGMRAEALPLLNGELQNPRIFCTFYTLPGILGMDYQLSLRYDLQIEIPNHFGCCICSTGELGWSSRILIHLGHLSPWMDFHRASSYGCSQKSWDFGFIDVNFSQKLAVLTRCSFGERIATPVVGS